MKRTLIRTERLEIRPFDRSFLEEYVREFTAEITKYQYPDPFPDRETADRVLSGFVSEMEQGNMLELVILTPDGGFLGSMEAFGLRQETPELGLWLKRTAHGKGYGREALQALLELLGAAGSYPYYLYEADVRNTPSLRLAERFRFEKGGREDIVTEAGKELRLQQYRIFPPGPSTNAL